MGRYSSFICSLCGPIFQRKSLAKPLKTWLFISWHCQVLTPIRGTHRGRADGAQHYLLEALKQISAPSPLFSKRRFARQDGSLQLSHRSLTSAILHKRRVSPQTVYHHTTTGWLEQSYPGASEVLSAHQNPNLMVVMMQPLIF